MNHSNAAEWMEAANGVPDRGGAPPVGGGTTGGDAGAAYLEPVGKHCDNEEHEPKPFFEVRPCRCRSWFCPHCCTGKGLTLRERLIPIVQTFTALQMWTFTLDPKLFNNPADAFSHVRQTRALGNVIRKLRRWGFLHSARYFYVVEWQKNGMPHFHVLLDASHIPVEKVREAWNAYIPKGFERASLPAGLGWVKFSAPRFKSPEHAAHYACKYLIKYPQEGYPDWVLDSHDIHRYGTSRGFWGQSDELEDLDDETEASPEESSPPDGSDCCPACGHVEDGACDHCSACGWSALDEPASLPRRTIREGLAKCGAKAVLLRVTMAIDPQTGELRQQRHFLARLRVDLGQVASALGKPDQAAERYLMLDGKQAAWVQAVLSERKGERNDPL